MPQQGRVGGPRMTQTAGLGERMKWWENVYRDVVPGNDYLLLRLDGRAFHTYTRRLHRPYDKDFMAAMDATMVALCQEIDGVRLGYCQSDEISLVVTNWTKTQPTSSNPDGIHHSEAWLGGVGAKLLSISASVATMNFNTVRNSQNQVPNAVFDSRMWTIPWHQPDEVMNYLLWRQRDAIKNSVTMAASTMYSHRHLQGVNTDAKKALMADRGTPWEELPQGFRQGRFCTRFSETADVTYVDKRTQTEHTISVNRRPFRAYPAPLVDTGIFDFVPRWEKDDDRSTEPAGTE